MQLLTFHFALLTVFLAPLAVFPLFTDPFTIPKTLVLSVGVLAVMFFKALRGLSQQKNAMSIDKLDLPLILMALGYVVVTIVRTPNKADALFIPGNATVVLAGVSLYGLINQLNSAEKRGIRLAILASGLTVAIIRIITVAKALSFTLFANELTAIVFLALTLLIAVFEAIAEKNIPKKALFVWISLMLVAAIAITLPKATFSIPSIALVPIMIAASALLTFVPRTRPVAIPIPKIILLASCAATISFAFLLGRCAYAEFLFKRASDALVKNQYQNSYELLQHSININPYIVRYHIAYAQLNMVIAQQLGREDANEEKRAIAAALREQAINEGKKAVFLNKSAENWIILGTLYEALPATQDSEKFAVQAYLAAIFLNPKDPNPRLSLARVYWALGEYDKIRESLMSVLPLVSRTSPEYAQAQTALLRLAEKK